MVIPVISAVMTADDGPAVYVSTSTTEWSSAQTKALVFLSPPYALRRLQSRGGAREVRFQLGITVQGHVEFVEFVITAASSFSFRKRFFFTFAGECRC